MLRNLYALALAAALAAPAAAQRSPQKKARAEQAAPAPPAADPARRYAATITQDDLRRHLTILASDEYEGRETGEKGQKMAADYLARQFRELGLKGPGQDPANSYLQPFSMERSRWATEHMQLQIGGQRYGWLTDFYSSGDSPFAQETTLQPVFVGYGIEQAGYSDYAGLDVRGKDLVALLGEPLKDGQPLLAPEGKPGRWSLDSRAKAALATAKGARSVIFLNPDATSFTEALTRFRPYLQRPRLSLPSPAAQAQPARAATFFVSTPVGLALLGTDAAALTRYQNAVAKAGQPVKSPFRPAKVVIRAPRITETFRTENVLGYLEGRDKKDELLVVSAHYDHLGIRDGKVYNGADDDGSGTSAVLELAQAFVQAQRDGHGPRRSILFLAVTAEEQGLYGSEYYAAHPVVPLTQTVANLNIDMIGRTDENHAPGDQYVCLVGADKLSSELHALSEDVNRRYTQLGLDYRYNDPNDPEQVYYRSDHYNFARHRIPVIFYTTGDHADYHQETDEVDRIEFPLMEKRARLVFHTAWEVANRDQRLVVDSNKP
ncbi:M28 family peptidase [Hymenobacter sp. B81]|uniref:M28 family peptidase n=1 Tax=Hymenobacter sp. B81 TaxID=3344878 RepID=UPI0037DD436D